MKNLSNINATAGVTGNASTASKLQTPRKIGISGGVTGTPTNFDGSGDITIPITSIDPQYLSGGVSSGNRLYLNTHPENGGAIIPFINNDLAFLTKKGGSMSAYKTTATDFTALTLANSGAVGISTDFPFDGSPSYAGFSISAVTDKVIIDITCHTIFAYGTNFYIDFGNNGWSAKDISFYAYNSGADNNETVYKLMGSKTNNDKGSFNCYNYYSYTNKSAGTSQGFNKLRIVLTNFSGTSPRIAAIGLISYGSSGLRETFIPKDGGYFYGDLTPFANNVYEIGDSTHFLSHGYINTLHVNDTSKVANLNAEMVDGKHISDLMLTATTFAANLDTTYKAGRYGFSTSTVGRPCNYGIVDVVVGPSGDTYDGSSNWIWQIANGTAQGETFIRIKVNNGAWSSWTKPSSSNADTVDNKHASDFYPMSGEQVAVDPNSGVDGVFYFNGTVNAPPTFPGDKSGHIYQRSYNSAYITQIAISFYDGMIAFRNKNNGTWGSWATTLQAKYAGNTDLNSLIQSGAYRFELNNPNKPPMNYGNVLVVRGNESSIAQMAFDISSSEVYWRSGYPASCGGGGDWSPWRRIWHDGNDAKIFQTTIPTSLADGAVCYVYE